MTLITHCGARDVTWGDLEQIPTPPATETWFPLSHSQVLGSVVQTLDAAGFGVQSMSLAVTPDDARFFGTLQLKAEILPGVGLAVGVRNSIDRSLPIGFCCGQWVLVCDYADHPIMWSSHEKTRYVLARRHFSFYIIAIFFALSGRKEGVHVRATVASVLCV